MSATRDLTPAVHVVVCTYNRADRLAEALQALAGQEDVDTDRWETLVVDNNCTDHTVDIVQQFVGRIPGLRIAVESRQGLTEARQRGFWETDAPWVAFVDDDCIVEPDWIRHVLDFIDRRPDAAAFNGNNILELEIDEPRPWVTPGMFASASRNATAERTVRVLVGAGLVLNRQAVLDSGWLDSPRAEDRRGNSLISGGDNELAIRAGAAGGGLWYVPQCRLRHRVDAERLEFGYLVRLNFRLAESVPLLRAMRYHGDGWPARLSRFTVGQFARLFGLRPDELLGQGAGIRGRLLLIARTAGFVTGALKLMVSSAEDRQEIVGLATPHRIEELARSRS